MDILSIKENSHSCSHLLLKIHKSDQNTAGWSNISDLKQQLFVSILLMFSEL